MDKPKVTSLPPDLTDVMLYEQRSESRYADEISLVVVWLALMRRKFILAAIVLVSVAFGFVYTYFTPHLYAYTTILEIGTNGRNALIESLETARAKVVDGYIAQVLRERLKKSPDDAARYEIKAEVPKSSQVLILRSEGTADKEPVYAALHDAVVTRLKLDHQRVQNVLREDLNIRLKMRERSLAELRDQTKLFEAQLTRLEGKRDLPAREMVYLTSLRLSDNQRAQAEMVAHIDGIRLQLAEMRETGATMSPMRSLDPVDLGKKTTVMLSGLIGIFLGIIVALFVDFVARTREEAARRTQAA